MHVVNARYLWTYNVWLNCAITFKQIFYNALVTFAGFAGSSALDEAKILMILGCAVDTTESVVALFGMTDDEAKASTLLTLFHHFLLARGLLSYARVFSGSMVIDESSPLNPALRHGDNFLPGVSHLLHFRTPCLTTVCFLTVLLSSSPCGFHVRACLLMLDLGFLSIWRIELHFRRFLYICTGS